MTVTDEPILVCMRIADIGDKALVPSLPNFCSLCGWRVWVSLASPPVETIWCSHCAKAKGAMKDGAKVYATKKTLAEVAAYLTRTRS
jgi:hypothetical protein